MRQAAFLRQRYRLLAGFIGRITAIVGLFIASPVLLLPFYPQETPLVGAFLLPAITLVLVGGAIAYLNRPRQNQPLGITTPEGTVIVVVVWIVAVSVGTIPFMLESDMTFLQGLFESTSGWTGTGLSIMDVSQASHLILFYRSIIQVVGGAGFAIIVLSALFGTSGLGLSLAEGRTEQLAPNVRQSANIVLQMYLAYIVIGVIALRLAGMTWFDAINHSMTAVATGGFSTKMQSIGYWDSALIEVIIIALMLLGSINFLSAYTLLKGQVRAFIWNAEIRLLGRLLPVASLLVVFTMSMHLYPTFDRAVRVAVFELVSALTTTGFAISDYRVWSDFGVLMLVIMMVIGGGSGSTAGALKQFRVYVLAKGVLWDVQRAFLPPHAVNEPEIWQGDERSFLDDRRVRQIASFVFVYLVTLLIGTLILTGHGYSLKDSLFEFASSLGTAGLTIGITNANAPDGVMWAQIIGMILGRLEITALFIGLFKLGADAWFLARNRPQPKHA